MVEEMTVIFIQPSEFWGHKIRLFFYTGFRIVLLQRENGCMHLIYTVHSQRFFFLLIYYLRPGAQNSCDWEQGERFSAWPLPSHRVGPGNQSLKEVGQSQGAPHWGNPRPHRVEVELPGPASMGPGTCSPGNLCAPAPHAVSW